MRSSSKHGLRLELQGIRENLERLYSRQGMINDDLKDLYAVSKSFNMRDPGQRVLRKENEAKIANLKEIREDLSDTIKDLKRQQEEIKDTLDAMSSHPY